MQIISEIKTVKKELRRTKTVLQMDELKSRKRVLRRYHYALLSEIKYVKLVTVSYSFNLYPNIVFLYTCISCSRFRFFLVLLGWFSCFCLMMVGDIQLV